jgi:hypothetical protein
MDDMQLINVRSMRPTCSFEIDRREFTSSRSLLRSHRPERRMTFEKSRRCHQMDFKQGAFSGRARERQNPVDLAKLATDFALPHPTQAEPSNGTEFSLSLLRISRLISFLGFIIRLYFFCLRFLRRGSERLGRSATEWVAMASSSCSKMLRRNAASRSHCNASNG